MSLLFSQVSMLLLMMFMATSHPMTLGFLLMMISIMYSILIFLGSSSPWLPFILMMVFLSGSMVIFIYMTSISSNETISLEAKFLPLLFLLLVSLITNNLFLFNFNLKSLNPLKNMMNTNSMEMIYKTYNMSLSMFTLFIIIYLLLMMIVAVKITVSSKTPLR